MGSSEATLAHKPALRIEEEEVLAVGIVVELYGHLVNAGAEVLVPEGMMTSAKYFLLGIEALILAVACLVALKRSPLKTLACLMVLTLVLLLVLLVPFGIGMDIAMDMARYCAPVLIIGLAVRDWSVTMRYLTVTCEVVALMGVAYSQSRLRGISGDYSMWFGYQELLPIMLMTAQAVVRGLSVRSAVDGVIVLIVLYEITLTGSRNPLLIAVIWAAICLLLGPQYDAMQRGDMGVLVISLKTIARLVIACILAALLIANIEAIAGWAYERAKGIGVESRTLRVLSMSGALNYVSNRDMFAREAIRLIAGSPLFGYGPGGDRLALSNALGAATSQYVGMYPHNIILEVLMQYGVILGFVFTAVGVARLVRALKGMDITGPEGLLFLIVTVSTLGMLAVSGSYLTSVNFYLLVAMCISYADA